MEGLGAAFLVLVLFMLGMMVFMLVTMWKINTKAGEPGWAVIIPIYNMIVWLKMAGKPWWWFILLCIPLLNIVFIILWVVAFSKSFGKGGGFAAGLIFLGFIFYPMLAFGSAEYVGPQVDQA